MGRSSPRLLLVFTLAIALVVGIVASLATGSWWFLAVAMLVQVTATSLVLSGIGSRLDQKDKPDPLTEARLAEPTDDRRNGAVVGHGERAVVGGAGRGRAARPEDRPHEPPF
jgi:membrane protein implicated in regulation of membrane protease activity